jgi:hypothetical protein
LYHGAALEVGLFHFVARVVASYLLRSCILSNSILFVSYMVLRVGVIKALKDNMVLLCCSAIKDNQVQIQIQQLRVFQYSKSKPLLRLGIKPGKIINRLHR